MITSAYSCKYLHKPYTFRAILISNVTKTKQKRQKTRVAALTSRRSEKVYESDSTYFLKLVVFVLLGTFWLKFQQPIDWLGLPLGGIPVGAFVGVLLVHQFEKIQSDRKLWYMVLLVMTIVCYFVPAGIVI